MGSWALEAGASAGFGIVVFALSIVLAGVLLASGEPAADAARRIAERLVPDRGAEIVALAGGTVQSVTRGILGTAFIQSFLAGIGLLAAGVPAAGLWALLVLLFAVVQLPPLLVLVPIIVWVFASKSTGVAVLFAIWSTAVGASDNVLKPLLLGRGSDVPMAVIFIGAIGGFMRAGLIGLFVGAVVLAVGHNLFKWWLETLHSHFSAPFARGGADSLATVSFFRSSRVGGSRSLPATTATGNATSNIRRPPPSTATGSPSTTCGTSTTAPSTTTRPAGKRAPTISRDSSGWTSTSSTGAPHGSRIRS